MPSTDHGDRLRIADDRVMTRDNISSHAAREILHFGRPELADGTAIHALIGRSPPLDLNSSYSYFLLCAHHADTCVVARHGERLAGFISAYRLPHDAQTLFIWQVAVDSTMRGRGLAGRMLASLLARPACAGVQYIETTVAPGNLASRALFTRFAQHHRANVHESLFLGQEQFGAEAHETEMLLRIGPLQLATP